MNWLIKAIKWYFEDFWKYIGFLVSVFLLVVLVMTFIAYPWQTIGVIVGGFAIYALFVAWLD